jgi:hypothetical protein
MIDAVFNTIINTLIRGLSIPTRNAIGLGLFLACLVFFNKSIRTKNELRPIRVGYFVMFILCLTLAVLYVVL